MDSIRAFIAIELPADAKLALQQAQTNLRAANSALARAVKWVNPDSIHLTLKFLGETPTGKLDAIGAALDQAAAGSAPFLLHLAAAGGFPNLRQPRVLWAGLQGDLASLQALQAAVEKTVSPLGFPSEERRFSPHLTVGRLRDDASPEARAYLGSAIQALHLAPAAFTVRGISLMRSDLQPQGAVYTRLYEARLGQLVAP